MANSTAGFVDHSSHLDRISPRRVNDKETYNQRSIRALSETLSRESNENELGCFADAKRS